MSPDPIGALAARVAELEDRLRSAVTCLAWAHPGDDSSCPECRTLADACATLGIDPKDVQP